MTRGQGAGFSLLMSYAQKVLPPYNKPKKKKPRKNTRRQRAKKK